MPGKQPTNHHSDSWQFWGGGGELLHWVQISTKSTVDPPVPSMVRSPGTGAPQVPTTGNSKGLRRTPNAL